ncbi:MAG: UDP-N-acetylglucosamine 2-epimerase (non-hydrolyzing) [Alphaproteobacteria bacterium]|nr:UDP-N-acetylglucosamine 2-epimerase (non-hydrolyzing) [Alphaproteobacteria bacterium]
MRKRILCLVGTRPEIIKMSSVVNALRETAWADLMLVSSGQHRDMAASAFSAFGLSPDIDLDVMTDNQTLSGLTSRLFEVIEPILVEQTPDLVIAQGDTTTVMAAAMSCFYQDIPFAHVEAGLRTGNTKDPFPEEFNRTVCGKLSALHFAPTEAAYRSLVSEGVAEETIAVTGNTVIDAVMSISDTAPAGIDSSRKLILMTAHRRENFGVQLENVFRAVSDLLDTRDDVELLYPVHPNPNVAARAREIFENSPRAKLCEPLQYEQFVGAMRQAHVILSDSGGVQEEAPALGIPVLVIRNETERPDALMAGVSRLVGTDYCDVRAALEELLDDEQVYRSMARGVSPYGDGAASARIIDILEVFFGFKEHRHTSDFVSEDWLAQSTGSVR